MSTAPQITVYQRPAPRRLKIVGVVLVAKAGDPESAGATWEVAWDVTLPAGVTPEPGDRVRDSAGVWWVVHTVGTKDAAVWPVLCGKAA